MLTNISKWGNSLGIRIPHSIIEKIGLSEGESVEITIENNHIVVQKTHTLESLIAKITPENIHSEVDTGSSIGRETW